MKKLLPFVIFLLTTASCNTIKNAYNPATKFSPQQLREDFSILQKTLRANHPSLYWYTSQPTVNSLFSDAYDNFNDSLTEQQFRKRVSWVINNIHCGHTVVRPSKGYTRYYNERKIKSFPLLLKVWGDSAVVITNLFKEDSIVKQGTIITHINGVAVGRVTDSMCQLISSDGYSKVFKYQLISFNFPAFYRYAFGLDSTYAIQYVDSTGKIKEKVYKNFYNQSDSLNSAQTPLPGFLSKKQLRKYKLSTERKLDIDSATNTAIIAVNTFSKGRLIRFFHKTFREIKQKHVKNIVLDLRLNTGGSVLACTRLSQYLINRPFHVADTVATFNWSFPYKKYVKPWFIYWLNMRLSCKRMEDGRIHFRYFERHLFRPKTKNHFNGNIYILTGGYTFSAATLVASNLKGQKNVTIVGEETGGGAYGNSAMLLTTINLPNTGLRITLPLFRMVLDASRKKDGRGILPDVEVRPSSGYIKGNVDAKLERALQLIRYQ